MTAHNVHPADALMAEAEAAIRRMQDSAREARLLHAMAELARHMRATAARMTAMPADQAAEAIAAEWLKAWGLAGSGWPGMSGLAHAFALAFATDAADSTPATREAIARSMAALDAAFRSGGSSLGDEMAFRSECAHGWWSAVVPVPEGRSDPARLARLPRPAPGEPFWSAGPQAHCLPQPD
jgi:hypothetical protein